MDVTIAVVQFGIQQFAPEENLKCVARAFENEIILVYANAAGRETFGGVAETLIGRSQIIVPFKGAVNLLDHNREGMFLQTVDMAILHDAEQAYEIRSDLSLRLSLSPQVGTI